jgi:hypothetical protein
MKIKGMGFLALMGLLCNSVAFADLKFGAEPYVGYGLLGGASVTVSGVTQERGNFTGFGVGARGTVGFAEMFFAGLDLSYYPSFSYSPPSGTTITSTADGGAKSLKAGLVAGVTLPAIPLRFWLGWNILDRVSDSAPADIVLKGMSFKVGAGYKVIPLLSLNAEYIMASYGTYDVTTSGVTASTTGDFSFSHKMLLLSASVPFEF